MQSAIFGTNKTKTLIFFFRFVLTQKQLTIISIGRQKQEFNML